MSYEATMNKDLVRVQQILDRGKAEPPSLPLPEHIHFGGTIYGGDIYPAYRLLESLREEVLRLRAAIIAAQPPNQYTCRTSACGHAASLHPGGVCVICNDECWM